MNNTSITNTFFQYRILCLRNLGLSARFFFLHIYGIGVYSLSLSLSIDVSFYVRNIVFCDLQMYYFKNETTLRK